MTLDRFLFAPVDRRMARILRVLLVLVLIAVFWPEGRATLGWITRRPEAAALWAAVFLSPAWWAATLVALVAFAAGVGGRASGWIAAALLLPLLFARDAQSRQILLMALVALSLLRTSSPRAASRPGPDGGSEPSAGPIWPVRLIQLQLSTVYAVNVWAKLTPGFLSGEVLVGLSGTLPNVLVDLSDGSLHLGPLAVPVWLCAVATVAIESALAVGLWIPKLRIATALLGVGFHAALRLAITIGWLDWACVSLYLAFLLPFERVATARAERVSMDDSFAPGATR